MPKTLINLLSALLTVVFWLSPTDFATAHHVLGRPAYGLNEDSNTPPDMQAEIQVGDYLVAYMVFPAFPRPGEPGRINLYATRVDDGSPFEGEIAFKVRGDSWLSWLGMGDDGEKLGHQSPDDNVFRQGFIFREAGDYIVTAEFQAGGKPYVIDFPLRVGKPPLVSPIGVVGGVLLIALVAVSVIQRRRLLTAKIRSAHEQKAGKS